MLNNVRNSICEISREFWEPTAQIFPTLSLTSCLLLQSLTPLLMCVVELYNFSGYVTYKKSLIPSQRIMLLPSPPSPNNNQSIITKIQISWYLYSFFFSLKKFNGMFKALVGIKGEFDNFLLHSLRIAIFFFLYGRNPLDQRENLCFCVDLIKP